jgi:4-amino-4-deoxy-L-arabinose transferase-like glycosyltransferase
VSVAWFGEHYWSIRLPAVIFGIATIPAIYWLARTVMGGWQSLAVAFLTAVSYHHVWFSQNARGYSGYLLFCVIATTAFWHLIHSEESRWIWIYAVSAVLGLASLIIAAPVIATHVMLAAFYVFRASRRGETIAPLVRRLLIAFSVTGLITLALYGPTAVQILRSVGSAYITQGTGFDPKSLDFLREALRGLGAGFGSLALVGAIPFVALVAFGILSLMRRAWIVVLSFVIPLCILAALVIVAGWLTSPRFFILVVPLAFLVAVESLDIVARLLARFAPDGARHSVQRGLAGAAVIVCALALAFGLPRYYAVPKQSFRAAISAFNARSQQGDALIAVYQADRGFDMYTHRLGLDTAARYFSTRTAEGFDSLGTRLSGRRVWLATTMERAFKLEEPGLWKRVEDGWTPVETFPATVGNGEITIWEPKR